MTLTGKIDLKQYLKAIFPEFSLQDGGGVASALFAQLQLEGWPHSQWVTFQREEDAEPEVPEGSILCMSQGGWARSFWDDDPDSEDIQRDRSSLRIYRHPLGWIQITLHQGGGSIGVIGATPDDVTELVGIMYPTLPRVKTDDQGVSVSFWANGKNQQGWSTARKLVVPEWSEVRNNYPDSTRHQLDELMAQEYRPTHGKLFLWHGEPGTGKTWAIRALMRAWASWVRPQYIVDPEQLFGTDSQYLLQVLLAAETHAYTRAGYSAVKSQAAPWRLLILEDTGELLTADAKERTGQGLSRLLNVTDGLIGQGLNLSVLITTNESISKLHPAVSRPGRAASEIEFSHFDATQAQEWLETGDYEGDVENKTFTLAELYALLGGRKVGKHRRQAVGFAR